MMSILAAVKMLNPSVPLATGRSYGGIHPSAVSELAREAPVSEASIDELRVTLVEVLGELLNDLGLASRDVFMAVPKTALHDQPPVAAALEPSVRNG